MQEINQKGFREMTEKQRECALKRLYGRNTKAEIKWIVVSTVLLLLCVVVTNIFFVFKLFDDSTQGEKIGFGIAMMLPVAEALYFLWNLIVHFKHCAELKERYHNLPYFQQEELLKLAYKYNPEWGICYNDEYILGMVSNAKKKGMIGMMTPKEFDYVALSDVIWIYKRIVSAASWDMYSGGSLIRMPQEDQIVFYVRDGRKFAGLGGDADMEHLFSTVRAKSPMCKCGYRKEWEKELS